MENWYERLMNEEAKTRSRLAKLNSFIAGPDFTKLSKENQALLIIQVSAMKTYIDILLQRIRLNADNQQETKK